MNVYDFDNTIFIPDSTYCFIRYCDRHYPRAVLKVIPSSLVQFILYLKAGKQDAGRLKESLFSFLNRIDNIEEVVLNFWEEYFCRIEDWYLQQKQEDDLIISASPEFLLQPAAQRLGVRLIATPMNPYTGKILGKNCHDTEKTRRYRELYETETVHSFYSDSLSDSPMAGMAEEAWIVKDHQCYPWPTA